MLVAAAVAPVEGVWSRPERGMPGRLRGYERRKQGSGSASGKACRLARS
jgi:hypothetical protein